jgi:hypothetical protein
MRAFFPLIQVLLVFVILAWDVYLTGRIAQVRTLPRPFVTLSALAGFLLVPALLIHLATASSITGRAITAVDWLWPTTVVLFALQALYAAARRLVNPFLGFFIAVYDIIIAIDAVLRFIASRGTPLSSVALIFLAATTGAFAFMTQSPTILGSPFFFFIPMIAPAFPSLRRSSATFRLVMASIAGAWVVIIFSQVPSADQAIRSYQTHDPRVEKLQERPAGDFDIGLKIFPDLEGMLPPLAARNDLALIDTLGVGLVNVVIVPETMNGPALDSLAKALEETRADSTVLVVTLGYASKLVPLPGRTFTDTRRLQTIDEVVRRLKPDVLLPAQDPYGAGTVAAGPHPPQYWEDYISRASAIAKRARPRTRIGLSASAYDRRDSTLYAWAAAAGSPVDIVGFSLFPSPSGVRTLDAAKGAADRWMAVAHSTKDHWIWAAGGYPEAHGESSQESAVWAALAWATTRPLIKAVIVSEAGDYGTIKGLRAADGHLRRAAYAVRRAMKGLRESAAPDTTTEVAPVPAVTRGATGAAGAADGRTRAATPAGTRAGATSTTTVRAPAPVRAPPVSRVIVQPPPAGRDAPPRTTPPRTTPPRTTPPAATRPTP